ncbi:MAG: hypothetical protein GXZ02_02145, partial [Clostridiales bacterium]|nr:hypothetical protein [Clostridiales bacterium]
MMKSSYIKNKKQSAEKSEQNKKAKNKSKIRIFFTVVFSLLTVFVLTGVLVTTYVLCHIVSFTNGDVEIDLDDYKKDQSKTSFVYANDKNGKEILIAK